MKTSIQIFLTIISITLTLGVTSSAYATSPSEQSVSLSSGWNIVSTPKVLASHSFSIEETSENFDIYILDASRETGWATMSDLGQSEFTPLYGYFINNKTGSTQTLTFTFANDIPPNEKLFERIFSTTGWYSIGVANAAYAKEFNSDRTDTDNPNRILSLLENKYDLVIDFTDALYLSDRKSLALSDPWKGVVQDDIDDLNDFRDMKGYAIYIKEPDARYSGFQNNATSTVAASSTLTVKASPDDPDATTLQVDETSKSDFATIFVFDLKTSESAGDVILHKIPVTIQTGAANEAAVVSDAYLLIDGNTYDDYTWNSDTNTSATYDFDIDNYILDAGNTVTVEVYVEFQKQENNYAQGETIFASTIAANYDAEADDGVIFAGSVTGNTHTLRTEGADLEMTSSTETLKANNDATTDDDEGVFTIKFDVTAFETDIFVTKTASEGTSLGTSGVNYQVEDSSGVPVIVDIGVGTTTASLTSTANTEGGKFKISEGETEAFTLTVNFDPETQDFYQLQLHSLNWANSATNPTVQQLALPAEDFETDALSI